jgi:ribonucleoside-diphosphate reductase alpha chain
MVSRLKEGSTLSGFMDGLALSISIGLQYGVPLKALVDKLTNARFEPSGFTENPVIRHSSSVLDYIARWLGSKFLSSEYLKPSGATSDQGTIGPPISPPAVSAANRKPIQSSNSGGTTGDAPSCSTRER